MKRLHVIVGIVLMMSIVAACSWDNVTPNDDGSDDKTYVVAHDTNFVPFEFLNDETGEYEGFDIELMKAIADEAGINVTFEATQFDGIIGGIESGRYDAGIAGITITEEREKKVDFSEPYYDAGLLLAVQDSNQAIKSVDDLTSDMKVSTRTGSTSERYLEQKTNVEVVSFPGVVEAYMELESGRVDATLYDAPNLQYYINNQSKADLKTVGDVLQGEQYGIAFQDDSDLVERVNDALQTLKKNGTYEDIYKKWFGSND